MEIIVRYWELEGSPAKARYRGAYQRGWNYSGNLDIPNHRGLDGNPCSGALYWAWEDGYLDRAAGREFGHLLKEHDHDKCP